MAEQIVQMSVAEYERKERALREVVDAPEYEQFAYNELYYLRETARAALANPEGKR